MTAVLAGIVLPADLLVQPWFGVFGLFVALNTIIYLGLTAARFVPWPAQIHPSRVRRLISDSPEEAQVGNSYRSALRAIEDPAEDLRDVTAQQTIPIALALVGSLTAAVGLLYLLLYYDDGEGAALLLGPPYGFLLIVLALVLNRVRASAWVMVWSWVGLMLVFIAETSWRAAVLDSAVPLAFALVALGFTAPISLSWRAGLVACVLGSVPIIVAGAIVSFIDTLSWTLAATSAALASFVLLYLRRVALERIAEERARADALASTDPLTGTFSRAGLIALAPSVADAASRGQEPVSAVICTVPEFAGICADYGFDYGGDLLAATARAFRASLPERALVARWGGERFLAVLTGAAPEPTALRRTVEDALVTGGVALGKAAVSVHVGTASGSPESTTLEALVADAERTAVARA